MDYKEINKKALVGLVTVLILIVATAMIIVLGIGFLCFLVFMMYLLAMTLKTYGLSLIAFCVISYGMFFAYHFIDNMDIPEPIEGRIERFVQWMDMS